VNEGILGLADISQARALDPRCAVYMFTPTQTDAPRAIFNTGNPNTGSILAGAGTIGFWEWSLPDWVQIAQVILVGGGSGGGSGQRAAAGGSRTGGGGGSGGGSGLFILPTKWIPNRMLTITVGAGGVGGAAVSSDTTAGNLGTVGGNTTVGFGRLVWLIPGGRAQTTYNAGGTGSSFGAGFNNSPYTGRAGGAGGAGAAGATPSTNNQNGSCGGGGGGAGIDASNNAFAGAAGSIGNNYFLGAPAASWLTGGATIPTAGTSGGGSGQSGWAAAGQVGNSLLEMPMIGLGGAGGGSHASSASGAGGDGSWGGGGGGGGASVNGQLSGAGGNGGPGLAVFLCWG
jgi:hypothetical protein